MNLLVFFWLCLKASLISTGGTANLPILYADLIPRRWATQRQFAEALAIGQISPGPNGLWVISLGYLIHGVSGALLTLAAIMLPPFLVITVDRIYRRLKNLAAVDRFVRGVSLAVVGIFLVVLASLLTQSGAGGRGALIMLASLALGATRRVPIVAILGLSAVAGMAFMRG